MRPQFNTIYGKRKKGSVSTTRKGGAKQAFKDECDINNIVAKFSRTGALPDSTRHMRFGEFDRVPDFQAIHIARAGLESAFAELPAEEQEIHGDALSWLESHDQGEGVPEGTPDPIEPQSGSETAEGESEAEAQLPS